MTATKVYVLGGLILVLVILFQVWYGAWPWQEPRAMELAPVWAGMIAYPIGLALGTVAILLGLLQVYVALPDRLKVATAIAYLVGAVIFSRALYRAIEAENSWAIRLSPAMITGLILLFIVLLFNLVGVLRFPPKAKT